MKRFVYRLAIVGALTGSFALAQNMPQRQNPPSQQQPSTSDQAKMGASTGDVQSDIQSALQKDPSLAGANISVRVSDQNVELSGTVPTNKDKTAAEQIAKSHSAGLNVKNHIKVAGASNPSNPGHSDND